MAQVTRCDKCGNLGDGRYFGRMVVYPPNQMVDAVRQVVMEQGFNVDPRAARNSTLELDICSDCYTKLQTPAPFMIASAEVKWPGEETLKEPTGAQA